VTPLNQGIIDLWGPLLLTRMCPLTCQRLLQILQLLQGCCIRGGMAPCDPCGTCLHQGVQPGSCNRPCVC
jgi:hypothetical protein